MLDYSRCPCVYRWNFTQVKFSWWWQQMFFFVCTTFIPFLGRAPQDPSRNPFSTPLLWCWHPALSCDRDRFQAGPTRCSFPDMGVWGRATQTCRDQSPAQGRSWADKTSKIICPGLAPCPFPGQMIQFLLQNKLWVSLLQGIPVFLKVAPLACPISYDLVIQISTISSRDFPVLPGSSNTLSFTEVQMSAIRPRVTALGTAISHTPKREGKEVPGCNPWIPFHNCPVFMPKIGTSLETLSTLTVSMQPSQLLNLYL